MNANECAFLPLKNNSLFVHSKSLLDEQNLHLLQKTEKQRKDKSRRQAPSRCNNAAKELSKKMGGSGFAVKIKSCFILYIDVQHT